jgi:cytochrome c peroxidase
MTTLRANITTGFALLVSASGFVARATPTSSSEDTPSTTAEAVTGESLIDGLLLFNLETFHGDGRVCATCHTNENNGTLSPAQAQALYARDPDAPLFRSIDSDDGVGSSYTRLLANATIRIHIPLPANIRPLDDLSATEAVFNRGIPTTLNTPALDPTLMSDGRAANLQDQALGAINSHFEPLVQPTSCQLDDIAAFEQTLFSSLQLAAYSRGAPLELPAGNTASEQRGRAFFTGTGVCGACHGGVLMNTNPTSPVGPHFSNALAGLLPTDQHPNPIRMWLMLMPDGSVPPARLCALAGGSLTSTPYAACKVPSGDPARALITGNPVFTNVVKIPILWNIRNTAPYFHDNSADTLQEVVDHYDSLFRLLPFVVQGLTPPGTVVPNGLSDQDKADIIAFMNLL